MPFETSSCAADAAEHAQSLVSVADARSQQRQHTLGVWFPLGTAVMLIVPGITSTLHMHHKQVPRVRQVHVCGTCSTSCRPRAGTSCAKVLHF